MKEQGDCGPAVALGAMADQMAHKMVGRLQIEEQPSRER
jgi:hypothetical protein